MTLKLTDCIQKADDLDIEIVGDLKFRGNCNKEDTDLIQFFVDVRFKYPEYAHLIFHPEMEMPTNGGASYAYHAKSKAKGRVDGLADIVCLPISKSAPAFICELKRANIAESLKNKKRKEHFFKQLNILSEQQKHGSIACVALGYDAAIESFKKYVNMYKA